LPGGSFFVLNAQKISPFKFFSAQRQPCSRDIVNNIAVKNNFTLSEYSLVTFPPLQVLYVSEIEAFFNSLTVIY